MNVPRPLVSQRSLAEDFRDPPITFRPVPFWSWNEFIEPDEVRRQANLLADAGLGGGFIHVRVGLTSGYMTDAWWAAVDAAVEASRARGLKVWFYDEDRWPSGYAGGAVPLAGEAFRMKGLLARPVDAAAPSDCAPIGEPVNGLQVYAWTSPLGNDWFHGTCYGDLLSADAMAKFLEEAYASYHARYGHLYGSDVLVEFTDEPNAMHRSRLPKGLLPHTTGLSSRFLQMHGYDPVPKLHLLFVDGSDAPRFRLHYFRTVNDLFETNFSRQLGTWCSEHGIALTGHYMAEHSLYEQQLWGVKVMANYRHQGVPGIDHLFRQVSETVTAKQCQSVVNQYAKPRMLSELYGVAGGSMTFADRWWIASQQMCLGVNLLNPHLLLYTMAGCRKRDYPQNMFYQQPWWPLNHVIDERLSRVCVALSHGRYVAEALIIHPQESSFVHWRTRSSPDPTDRGEKVMWEFDPVMPEVKPAIDALDAQLAAVTAALFGAQRTFDFGDETILADAGSVETRGSIAVLRVGAMRYPAVIVPSMTTIAGTTLALLERFQAAGGAIFLCGSPPMLLEGEPSQRLAAWMAGLPSVAPADLPKALARVVPPAVRARGITPEDAAKLYVHVRDLEDGGRLVFLTNLHRTRAFEAALSFDGSFRSLTRLDPATGEQKPHGLQGNEAAPLPFAEGESHLLYLSPLESDRAATAVRGPVMNHIAISQEAWAVRRLDDNALTLDTARWRESDGGELSARAVPVIAIQQRLNGLKYDGPLTLRYTFRTETLATSRKVHLVVEHPKRYRITINGRAVAYAGLPYYRDIRWLPIDITGLTRDGENVIELTCDFRHGDLRSVDDAFARYGTEIEAIYIVGDFDVAATETGEQPIGGGWERVGLRRPTVHSFAADSFVLRESSTLRAGDVTPQGLPFYAGRIEMAAPLPQAARDAATAGRRVAIAVSAVDCPVAAVAIDGETIGHFVVAPYEVDITDALAAGGETLTITLYGTLRNLMGAHHHPDGEEPAEHPHTFEPVYPVGESRAEVVERWGAGEAPKGAWRDHYCAISFGELGEVSLLVRER